MRGFAVGLAILAGACSENPFKRSYQAFGTSWVTSAGEPRLLTGWSDPEQEVRGMFEQGYGLLGTARVAGVAASDGAAVATARERHASYVAVVRGCSSGTSGQTQGASCETTAYFFAALPRWGMGVMFGEVPADVRLRIAPSAGVTVLAVRQPSPASLAGLRSGDVVLAVGEKPVTGVTDARRLVAETTGRETNVVIWRSGSKLSVRFFLPHSW